LLNVVTMCFALLSYGVTVIFYVAGWPVRCLILQKSTCNVDFPSASWAVDLCGHFSQLLVSAIVMSYSTTSGPDSLMNLMQITQHYRFQMPLAKEEWWNWEFALHITSSGIPTFIVIPICSDLLTLNL